MPLSKPHVPWLERTRERFAEVISSLPHCACGDKRVVQPGTVKKGSLTFAVNKCMKCGGVVK